MTRRITISVPDDVAARVEGEANASAFFTDAARARIRAEELTKLLFHRGISTSPEARALARAKLDAADRAWTPERWSDLRAAMRDRAGALGTWVPPVAEPDNDTRLKPAPPTTDAA